MIKKITYSVLLLIAFIIAHILIKTYFSPFFSIVLLSVMAFPIFKILCKKTMLSMNINALITIILVNTMIFLIIAYGGSIILIKLINLLSKTAMKDINDQSAIFNTLKANSILNRIESYINVTNIKNSAFYTTDVVISYFVANISLYFILIDNCAIVKCIKKYIPKNSMILIKIKIKEVKKIVLIESLLVFCTTVETILGFLALNISDGVFLGILCGILDILPYVGTLLVFMPLIIYNIYIKNYFIAVGLISMYVLIGIVRQIMEAKFMSINLKIHPLLMLISLYIGSKIFGIVGVLLGPIYLLIVKEIIIK